MAILWSIFTTSYFIYGEYQNVKKTVADFSYDKGVVDTTKKIVKKSEECQPFSIRKGQWSANLIGYHCSQVSKQELEFGQSLPPK